MSQDKAKQKGVEIKDSDDIARPRTTSTRSKLTLRPLPKIDPKDKGKKRIEEEDESDTESKGITEAEKKFKQLANDEEVARKVQEEWEAKKENKRLDEKEATKAALSNEYDFIQARIEANRILAARIQEEEREKFTVEERAKFLHYAITVQRRFLAQQRSEAIKNRPPTKNQLRNQMMTYLKHKEFNQSFIPVGSVEDEKMIGKMNKKAAGMDEEEIHKEFESTKEENKEEEGTRKRKLGTRKKIKSRKRRYRQDTSENDNDDEPRLCLTIAPDEDKEVDYSILDKKYPIIEWKSVCLGTKLQDDETKDIEEINLNMVVRSNRQKRFFSTLMKELSIFDKEDLNDVYKLVMDRYQDEIPKGFDRILWGDLMIMFNPNDEDEFWNSQQDWKIVSWKLHSSSRVHTLMTKEGIVIHMLVEERYPLKRKVLLQMLELKLESEEDSTMALKLIRLIKNQIDESEGHDGGEKDL
ncbi:hypothetical protein Tco_0647073 [Tanacetum coccineum]